MALVTKGTIEVNGTVADVVNFEISGGSTKEGKFAVNKKFLGYAVTPGTIEIKLSVLQQQGKPQIKWSELPDGFTLVRNYENGARHQFVDCTVSNDISESGDEANYTGEITLLASGRVEQ